MLEVDDQQSLKVLHEDVPASSWTLFPQGSQVPPRGVQSRPEERSRPDPGGAFRLAVDRGHSTS